MTIELGPELLERVTREAEKRGLSVQDYVNNVVERHLLHNSATLQDRLSPEEWSRKLDRWAEIFPQTPVLTDEALSRESIYGED